MYNKSHIIADKTMSREYMLTKPEENKKNTKYACNSN